jgi:transposase-like protein
MPSILDKPFFRDEAAAYSKLESIVWPHGPVCPHCGTIGKAGRLQGQSVRPGLWKCYACRKQFRVTVGTVFESSHILLHQWLQAVYLIVSSKKGFSSHQMSRAMGVTIKTAWFMRHRVREALEATETGPLGVGAGPSKPTRPM